ncbi:MAG: YggT family protein [Actinomycetota bacterium]|nr:YggT family protein [Actinomycetota bacterium]
MTVVFGLLYILTLIFFILLMIRLVFEWIQVFARDWRPRGIVLVVAEAAYTVTDPPIRAVRRVLPPLRIGRVALDLGFLVVFVACSILMRVFGGLAAG